MKKKVTALLSFLALWAIEAIQVDGNVETKIVGGLGATAVMATIGIVVGGLVLFNVFLFFYNAFKPKKKLSFSIYDKITAGLWLMIILEFLDFLGVIS